MFYSGVDVHTQALQQMLTPEYFGTVYSADKGENVYKHLRVPDKLVYRIVRCKKKGHH